MNYQCPFCLRTLSLGYGSYLYLRTLIMLHMARCEGAWDLAPDERVREVSRAAHFVLGAHSAQRKVEDRGMH